MTAISNIFYLNHVYGKKNGYEFKHAENGGEFYIKELGYYLDAYDLNKNTVLEFDEPHHYKNGKLKSKDIYRQKRIELFLKCKFIRLREDTCLNQ